MIALVLDAVVKMSALMPAAGCNEGAAAAEIALLRFDEVAGQLRIGEVVAADLADLHRSPLWMIDGEDITDFIAAQFACSVEPAKIFPTAMRPANARSYDAMFGGVAAFTHGRAQLVRVLPRLVPWQVALVMHLENEAAQLG